MMYRAAISLSLLFLVCTAQAVESMPTVSVTATDSTATINTTDHATLTFNRTGTSTADALTIKYSFSGPATTWDDYRRLDDTMPDNITIPAGQSSTTMTIKATGVNNVANPETASFTIFNSPNYTIGSPNSATITIYDGSMPSVAVTAADSIATIDTSDHATLTFSRTGSTSSPLTIRYGFGGSATTWDDYRRLDDTIPDNITIPVGQVSVTMEIKATGANDVANPETASFTILSNPSLYTLGSPNSASITIQEPGSASPPPAPPATGSSLDYTTLALPVPGDHALRILSPTLLELRLITTKPDPEWDSRWNFADSNPVQIPAASRFAVTVNGQPVAVEEVGFRRRPLYAPLKQRDLRIDNSLYLKLSTGIATGATVEVKNPDANLWPADMLFTALADPLRESMVIHVNQEGYAPSLPKKAMVGYYLGSLGEMDIPVSSGFQIVQAATGNVVFPGTLKARPDQDYERYSPPHYAKVLEADFTDFRTPGEYRLVIPGIGASLPFLINDGIPLAFARTYALGLYHQRCGVANEMPFTRHIHGACHTALASIPTAGAIPSTDYQRTWQVIAEESAKHNPDAYPLTRHAEPRLTNEESMRYDWNTTSPIPVHGGHHDAGDYSKYTINSAQLVHYLIFAVDSIPGADSLDLRLPESISYDANNDTPDLLDEAKLETDFLFRMQDPVDGGFYFLVYPRDRRYENVLPDAGYPQIVWPKTTAATAAAVAALAQAASSPSFKEHFPQAASDYLRSAEKGWDFLEQAFARFGRDGAYQKITHYGDMFMHDDEVAWAAVELYFATGEDKYRRAIDDWFPNPSLTSTFRWGWWRMYEGYGNAIRSYAFAARSGRNAGVPASGSPYKERYDWYLARCNEQIILAGTEALERSKAHAYASSFPEETKRRLEAGWYFSLDQAMDMAVAYQLLPQADYIDALVGNMNYEGGTNPVNVSYITGLGIKRQREIVHQYAQNDVRVLPPSGIPLGNIQKGFDWLDLYGPELNALTFPPDHPQIDPAPSRFPLYDRWADSYNVGTEFVHVNQARALVALAFLVSRSPAEATPVPGTVSIVSPTNIVPLGEFVTLRLAPGLDLNGARIVWEAREQEPAYGLTYTISPKSLGTHWVEAEVQWPDGRRAFANATFTADSPVVEWVDDAWPTGAVLHGATSWNWVTANPTPYSGSGTKAHQTTNGTAINEHGFKDATSALEVGVGDTLFAYVFLDPANPPEEIMLHWHDGSWEHRAYWGENRIPYGTNGTASRYRVDQLPPSGRWELLVIPASAVGLEGRTVTGMAFSAYGGRATFDLAGRAKPGATLP